MRDESKTVWQRVESEGGARGDPGSQDDRRTGLGVWGASNADRELEKTSAAGDAGSVFRQRRAASDRSRGGEIAAL